MDVLVIDDHSIVANAFVNIIKNINADWDCTVATSGLQAMDLIAQDDNINYVVIDVFLPDIDGLELAQQIRTNYPDIKLIALSASEDIQHVSHARELGALAYIPKKLSPENISLALQNIFAGNSFFPKSSELSINHNQQNNFKSLRETADATKIMQKLTKRQIQILRSLGSGKSNKEIAKELFISMNTVKIHVSSILKALALENRTQAAILARNIFNN
ncbi:MAG: response regulator transcription factor [Gammaproteobacteria bacterium]